MNRLDQARKSVSSLVKFLKKRDYCNADDLLRPLERAQREIERVVNAALDDVDRLLARYAEEAYLYAENRMVLPDGTPDPVSKREQRKATTELRRINKTKTKLLSLRYGP